jgi:hypothetical protein
MDHAWTRSFGGLPRYHLVIPVADGAAGASSAWEATVSDLLYIGLTIVVFGVLYLIVKGIETFER